jgi:Protein of unknown function (DUF2971)
MTVLMETPTTVTRFYGSVDFAVDAIENRQIALVHVKALNDPFDPYCVFETDFGDTYQNFLAAVAKAYPRDALWFSEHMTPSSWEQLVTSIKEFLAGVRESTFVLSTSASNCGCHPTDNLYMWGHYANGHRGPAIEFDTKALRSAVLKHHEDENGSLPEDDDV